ncbi:hypothetical protein [Nitrosomonas sp. ANs5]|uniref:hypothetical protein n=1 Tax=Nitrosomonas sp. ANs5 TaxID=3423941 RepID=UPI003D34D3D7
MVTRLNPIHHLPVEILPQPDETTCGPTCLHAVYRYWGKHDLLEEIIGRTRKLESGSGTFDVFLACDALRNGFQAAIYTYNLMVFDPTWFAGGIDIAERLRQQRAVKTDRRLRYVTEGYLEFLRLGGRLRLADLSHTLIYGLLRRGLPILTGLSSTFLYRVAREYGPHDTPDDIRGAPAGHFVVISGYNRNKRTLLVADPYGPDQAYWSNIDRVISAILLGIVTYDSNLLVIYPSPVPGQRALKLP